MYNAVCIWVKDSQATLKTEHTTPVLHTQLTMTMMMMIFNDDNFFYSEC